MAGLLVIDYKIDKIIKSIQATTKDANGNPLTYETVVNVIESQLAATVNGMANGDTVIWKYFGTFVATKRRVDMLNKKYESKGKMPTLIDNGLIRVSFKRDGSKTGETSLMSYQSKKDVMEPPVIISKEDESN